MSNTLNNQRSQPNNWKNEEKTAYILLGWWEESMKKRVESVANQIKGDLNNKLNRKIIITGYKFEIEKIKNYLKEVLTEENYNQVELEEVLSYDTRTNISEIKKRKPELFKNIDKFIIPASESHGHRVEMIFERLFDKTDSQKKEFSSKLSENNNKFTLEFIKSGEPEARYAGLAENIYRNVNPKILQYASIPFRPIKFVKGYLIPLIKENKNNKSKRNMKDYILSFFHKSNKRYALA